MDESHDPVHEANALQDLMFASKVVAGPNCLVTEGPGQKQLAQCHCKESAHQAQSTIIGLQT